MKRLLILSISATFIFIGGFVLMNNNVTSPVAPEALVANVIVEPIKIDTEVIETVVEETPVVAENIAVYVEPVIVKHVETPEELEARYVLVMLKTFIIDPRFTGVGVYTFTNSKLRPAYPEKFNSENLQSTIDYLVIFFDGVTLENFREKAADFHW
jgi:hypothetical protein